MFRLSLEFLSRVNNSVQASATKSSSNVQRRLDGIYQLPNTRTMVQISRIKKWKRNLGAPCSQSVGKAAVDVLSILQWMIFQHLPHNVM